MSADTSEESREIPAPDGLDALAAEAEKFDAAQIAPESEAEAEKTPENPAPTASSEREWCEAVGYSCGMVVAMNPGLEEEWTKERLDNLGKALAKAGAHYGWKIEKLLGHPVIGIAFAAIPLALGAKRFFEAKRTRAELPQPSA